MVHKFYSNHTATTTMTSALERVQKLEHDLKHVEVERGSTHEKLIPILVKMAHLLMHESHASKECYYYIVRLFHITDELPAKEVTWYPLLQVSILTAMYYTYKVPNVEQARQHLDLEGDFEEGLVYLIQASYFTLEHDIFDMTRGELFDYFLMPYLECCLHWKEYARVTKIIVAFWEHVQDEVEQVTPFLQHYLERMMIMAMQCYVHDYSHCAHVIMETVQRLPKIVAPLNTVPCLYALDYFLLGEYGKAHAFCVEVIKKHCQFVAPSSTSIPFQLVMTCYRILALMPYFTHREVIVPTSYHETWKPWFDMLQVQASFSDKEQIHYSAYANEDSYFAMTQCIAHARTYASRHATSALLFQSPSSASANYLQLKVRANIARALDLELQPNYAQLMHIWHFVDQVQKDATKSTQAYKLYLQQYTNPHSLVHYMITLRLSHLSENKEHAMNMLEQLKQTGFDSIQQPLYFALDAELQYQLQHPHSANKNQQHRTGHVARTVALLKLKELTRQASLQRAQVLLLDLLCLIPQQHVHIARIT